MDDFSNIDTQIDALIEMERFSDARKLLARAQNQHPDWPFLFYIEAKIAEGEGNLELALSLIQKALEDEPNDPHYRFMCCRVLSNLERNPEAERIIIDLIKDFPEDAENYSFYATIMLESNQIEKAFRLSKVALELDPDLVSAKIVYACHQCLIGDVKNAEPLLQELIRDNPDSIPICWVLLMSLMHKGKFDLALKIAQDMLRQIPNDKDLIEVICDLKVYTHWMGRPFYLFGRYGWMASVVSWFVALVVFQGLVAMDFPTLAIGFAICYGTWAIASWIIPGVLRREFQRKLA